ncbi:MAG: RNA polymerase sigma factor, partial [Anaerolineae bacterium]
TPEGFGRLFDRFYEPLLAYTYRRTGNLPAAQDVVAAVFEDALKQIGSFEWRGTPLSAWLYRLAANKVADYFRAMYRRPELALSGVAPIEAGDPPLEATLMRADRLAQLNRAIHALSGTDRLVINLIYFDALSREEAAQILGCTVNNVYLKLHRAIKRLKRQLEKESHADT